MTIKNYGKTLNVAESLNLDKKWIVEIKHQNWGEKLKFRLKSKKNWGKSQNYDKSKL